MVSSLFPNPDARAGGAPAIVVEDLTLRAGGRTIFEDVSFEVPAGSLTVLAGASGAGRTALALALAGRLSVTAGRSSVLSLVLALVSGPDVLVVDDVDQLRTADERRAAWAALLTLERTRRDDGGPLTVVATCQDWQELDDVLDPGHRLGALPLRPVTVHTLGAPVSVPTPDPETR
jgi:ATPase subunit of ABC transporter with duplicated ATPase domains